MQVMQKVFIFGCIQHVLGRIIIASSPYNQPTKEKSRECEFENCLVVLAGDS